MFVLGIRTIKPRQMVKVADPATNIGFRRPRKSESHPKLGAANAQPISINEVKNAASYLPRS